jgi:AAA domain
LAQSTNDITSVPGLFALFKGESGSGKSVAALSFPGAYVFDFDKKMPAIARKHFPGKEIHYDTFKNIFEVAEKLSEFRNICPYETLINDSVTSLVNMTLNTIGEAKGERVVDMLRTLSKKGNIELMSIDYYNGETNFIQRFWIDALKSLWSQEGNPKNVLTIAHVLTVDSAPDLKTKLVTRTRSIVTAGRKVAAYIPTQFDEVYHFAFERPDLGEINPKIKRICKTESVDEDYAKTAYRIPATIDFTDKSLYDELTKYVNLGGTQMLIESSTT